jgi:hypothetical protein
MIADRGEGEMVSLLRSIIESAFNCPTPEKSDALQWRSRKEPNAKWRSIMAKYRSPLSEGVTVRRREEAVDDGDWLDHLDADADARRIVALESK